MGFVILLSQFFYYIILLLVSVILCLYLYFRYSYTYWARKGLAHLEPKFPLGNNDCIGVEAFSFGTETIGWYKELKRRGLKLGGAWSWAQPILVVTDPDYIKDIMLKDFNHFTDRDFYHNPKYDPKNENIFVVTKDVWKNLRQKLSPVFTSAKMKMMFPTVVKCSEPMVALLERSATSGDDSDIKEVVASFTTDVIGCIAFGLEFGSFTSEDAKFRQMGKEIFRPTPKRRLFLILSRACSKLAQNIGIYNVPKVVTNFFTEIITENVNYRKTNNVKKPDFTQLLMDLHESTKGQENGFTFDDIIGNVILFFIAGFDTSSTTMHFALYELARNPELQGRARKEIQIVLNKYNGELTYDGIQEMTYLRQVIDETLRLYPPVQVLARICVQPYKFKNTDLTLEKDITVIVPILALGRDPEHFPDPEQFDPERFSPENKPNINPYAYLPFGEGPRNCIGKRFGIMQSSIGLIQILRNFTVAISPSTKMPLTLKRGLFLMQPNETLFLKIKKL